MRKRNSEDSMNSIFLKRKNLMTVPVINSLIATKIEQIDLSIAIIL